MAGNIKTIGVVGTGVIGSSWIGLFLAKGLQVLVSDPGPGAEQKLADYLHSIWPQLERSGLSPGASLSNYKFIGSSLEGHYESLDFVQEVCYAYPRNNAEVLITKRTCQNESTSRTRLLQKLTKELDPRLSLHLRHQVYLPPNSSKIARRTQVVSLLDIRLTHLISCHWLKLFQILVRVRSISSLH
jgi:hypothetical protein